MLPFLDNHITIANWRLRGHNGDTKEYIRTVDGAPDQILACRKPTSEQITFVRLTIVIYYKPIALTLLHEILVYWLFYQTDISSYLQFVWWYSSVPVLVLSKNILLTALVFLRRKNHRQLFSLKTKGQTNLTLQEKTERSQE